MSKIKEEGMTVDTYWEGKYSSRKETAVFLTGGGEAKSTERMEAYYASVWSQGME